VDIAIPSLYKYFDWDNDGIAGDEIYDGTQSFTMRRLRNQFALYWRNIYY
jgi:hypothetical protein